MLDSIQNLNFFAISFQSQNLLSFILGIIFAARQSYYKQRSGLYIVILYFVAVAGYYAVRGNYINVPKNNVSTEYSAVQQQNINAVKDKNYIAEYEALRSVHKK